MRENLQRLHGLRKEFTGVFERFGTKAGFKGRQIETIILTNIKCTSNERITADHLWFNSTKEFSKLDLQTGDLVIFNARVKKYIKGYQGYKEYIQYECPVEEDYKLSHPSKVRLLKRSEPSKAIPVKKLIQKKEQLSIDDF